MPRTRNPSRYRDIQLLCDIALAKGECIWEGPTDARARHIRQRFYAFRSLMERLDPASPYVSLQAAIRADNDKRLVIYENVETLATGIITEYDESDLRPPVPGVQVEDSGFSEVVDMDEFNALSPAERARRMLEEDNE